MKLTYDIDLLHIKQDISSLYVFSFCWLWLRNLRKCSYCEKVQYFRLQVSNLIQLSDLFNWTANYRLEISCFTCNKSIAYIVVWPFKLHYRKKYTFAQYSNFSRFTCMSSHIIHSMTLGISKKNKTKKNDLFFLSSP